MAENNNAPAKAPKKSWFKGLSSEFKKIIWPDKETVVKESGATIVVSVILALFIMLIDWVIKLGLGLIV